jgi:hypothetical protein
MQTTTTFSTAKTHVVVFRAATNLVEQGDEMVLGVATPADFLWRRSSPLPRWRADMLADTFRRDGHRALVERADLSLSIGLPETFA